MNYSAKPRCNLWPPFLVFAVLVAGCADSAKTIDTSSEAARRDSIEAIMDDLSPDERTEFEKALLTLLMTDFSFLDLFGSGNLNEPYFAKIEGKTFQEIIEMADEVRARTADQEEKEAAEWAERTAAVEAQMAAHQAEMDKAEMVIEVDLDERSLEKKETSDQ